MTPFAAAQHRRRGGSRRSTRAQRGRSPAAQSGSLSPKVSLHREMNGLLTVREKKLKTEARNRTYSERFDGRFTRQITLDREIDESAVTATFKNGVLTVTVPKSAGSVERT